MLLAEEPEPGGVRGASTSEARPEQTVEHVKVKGSPVISGGGGGT